jgi:hypothetical protein
MRKDEIISMARMAGFTIRKNDSIHLFILVKFAFLVAAAERKACAKLFPQPHMEYFGQEIQDAISARGEHANP